MSLFKDIVDSILLESVQISKITDAITKTYEVKINYQSDTDSASGERIIQPVAYGVTSKGNLVIRAFQPFGDTQTSVPSWKLFSVSGIKKWQPLTDRIFNKPEGFNPYGDRTMETVYTIAPFKNTSAEQSRKAPNTLKSKGAISKSPILNNLQRGENNKKINTKPLDYSRDYSDIIKNVDKLAQQQKQEDKINKTSEINTITPDVENNINSDNIMNNPQENNIQKERLYADK